MPHIRIYQAPSYQILKPNQHTNFSFFTDSLTLPQLANITSPIRIIEEDSLSLCLFLCNLAFVFIARYKPVVRANFVATNPNLFLSNYSELLIRLHMPAANFFQSFSNFLQFSLSQQQCSNSKWNSISSGKISEVSVF